MAFRSRGYLVTPSYAPALTVASEKELVLIGIHVTNVHASTSSWISARVVKHADHGGVTSRIAHEISVPINDRLDLMASGQKLVLQDGDTLDFQADNGSSLEVVCSYLETGES